MKEFFNDPLAMQEAGIGWVLVFLLIAVVIYLAPTVREMIRGLPERRRQSERVLANNTEALHLCRAALENNTEALRTNCNERDKLQAVLIEHDRKSEIRFEHQNEALKRVENKLE